MAVELVVVVAVRLELWLFDLLQSALCPYLYYQVA